MKHLESAYKLLEKCHASIESLYILSNWDKDSFPLIYQKFQTSIFSFFTPEHVVISGNAGFVKPQEEFFSWFLSTYNLDPATCFFIDDQKENVAAAQAAGIESLQFSQANEIQIQALLKRYGFCGS
jgi:FMN phosphatase YigB (HAD superfamily)